MYVYYDRCEHPPEKPSLGSYQRSGFRGSNNPTAREYAYLWSLKKRVIRTSTATDEEGDHPPACS